MRTGGLEHDVTDWGVDPRAAWALWLIPPIAVVAVAATIPVRPLFDVLTEEDHILEWLQVMGFAIAAAAGLVASTRLRHVGRGIAACFLLFVIGNVFIVGEEISWGQRIFGFETPEGLAEVNHQGETTLHNIKAGVSVQFLFNMAVLTIGMIGAVLPFVAPRVRLLRSSTARLIVPPAFLVTAFLMAGGYRLGRLVLQIDSGYVVSSYGEVTELCLAFGFAAFAVLSARRAGWLDSDLDAGPDDGEFDGDRSLATTGAVSTP